MNAIQSTNEAPAQVTVNISALAAKAGTKAEIYRLLTVEAGFYLPPMPTVAIWHCKDQASGVKTVSALLS